MTRDKQRCSLEKAIIDTLDEPLIVLDAGMHVVIASQSFYGAFHVTEQQVEGRSLFELGNGQWNIPSLRERLVKIIPHHTIIEGFEVEHDFPIIGRRTMLLNARKVFYEDDKKTSILLVIHDISMRRRLDHDKDELLRQKDFLLQEMNHRINNSLQIISSILVLKARTVQSEETRQHLQGAHERIMAVATAHEQLYPLPSGAQIEAKSYLTKLCESLSTSMMLDDQPVSVRVEASDGSTTSEQAVSMGLIATELTINALKHAFPGGSKGNIVVGFESTASAWRLSVSDDGVGISNRLADAPVRIGLGTSIVEALARQLGGRVAASAASPGTTVSVTVPRVA